MIGPGFAEAIAAETLRGCLLPLVGVVLALLLIGGTAGYWIARAFL